MIVVTTPTGNIGQGVLRGLLAANEDVRVIARDPSRIMPEAEGRVEIVQGSIDDPTALANALAEADTLFWCVPQSNEQTDVREYYLAFTRPLIKALKKERVARVVAVSSGGRGRARNAGPISALHAMEELIARVFSSAPYATVTSWRTCSGRSNRSGTKECSSIRLRATSRCPLARYATSLRVP